MDFERLSQLPYGELFASNPLLMAAVIALGISIVGGAIIRTMPRTGSLMRGLGSFGLAVVLVLTIIDVARLSGGSDFARSLSVAELGMPEQVVEGGETQVPLSRDGHYWLEGTVNGHPERFLIDTGASLTAISPDTAQRGRIEANPMRGTIALQTANGSSPGRVATMGELRAGNILARDLDVVIAPGLNGINVLGMNFLSRLQSWRVEDGTLILVPHNPQPV
ncbi:TIGR02281 family clan AA aspartic protease [Croceicoccus sp. Ery15]|jgi:aspartyl protease family protein|uniref:retropepsin-like aspartic protease family protein n=1 Tax=Croceicoccus sp. Ery15 TaxID=1703338 RepID=UPI001E60D2A3|nr:TIGR02281 family clan AA aspartic protease [Croceicoccus sp. Ery15]